MKCPACSQWFDMRDLAQVAEHIRDSGDIEILEGHEPPLREEPALTPLCLGYRGF
jgi:hypothetical protein